MKEKDWVECLEKCRNAFNDSANSASTYQKYPKTLKRTVESTIVQWYRPKRKTELSHFASFLGQSLRLESTTKHLLTDVTGTLWY